MTRPTVDNDPELAALQRLAQALDDAPDLAARERLILWAIDRFSLFTSPNARTQIIAAIAVNVGRLGIGRRELAIRVADELWGEQPDSEREARADRIERILRPLIGSDE